MKKSVKVLLLIAGCLVVLGLIGGTIAFTMWDINISDLSLSKSVDYSVGDLGEFSSVKISLSSCEVRIAATSESAARLDFKGRESLQPTVSADGEALCIEANEAENWYDSWFLIGFGTEKNLLTLYLPQKEYAELSITTTSGEISVGSGVAFASGRIGSSSGEVTFRGTVSGELAITASSGEVDLEGASVGTLAVNTTSGEINASDTVCEKAALETSSGEVDCERFTVKGSLSVKTASGSVELENSDADTLDIETASGEVEGKLLTPKHYDATSSSGRVKVPFSTEGGICRVKTSSGDIEFE